MIQLKNINTEYFSDLSFEIGMSVSCNIIADSDAGKKALFNLLTGRQKPGRGNVFIFDKDIYSLSEYEYIKLFTRVGMVLTRGGIISNLKVWENIILPVQYHYGKKAEAVEDIVLGILRKLLPDLDRQAGGMAEYMGKLTGPLPLHEKRIIGLVRTLLMGPELMIYDSIFEGFAPDIVSGLVSVVSAFHAEKPGRTSLYITTDEDSLRGIKADVVLRQQGERLKEETI